MTLEPELDFILAGPPGDPWCGPLLMPVGPQALGLATEFRSLGVWEFASL